MVAAVGEPPAHFAAGQGRLALAQQGRQHEPQHLAERVVVVAGGALAKGVERLVDDRFLVEDMLHVLEFGELAGLVAVDQPHQGAAAERHLHAGAAGGRRRARRQAIVEASRQGHRQGDLYDGLRRHGRFRFISCASVSSCYDSRSLLPGASKCGARQSASGAGSGGDT